MLASLAGVVILQENALATGNAGREVATAFSARGVTSKQIKHQIALTSR